uniref:Uncharacterized protein n=1 Tax=Candidatus Kentrum eta TaxID=2126337 RepID=A0A450URZ1_9GAMM|nr:MAG: hypothetical protein BECKH772A_GA0070896_100723 [Candidatus Kentron sp. H]VFJ95332.1 MAG: hypothetical protein BECKH772B_GA0070898_100753 [Candidatus Kentron sp. H]VFK01578.1 MAG: hypothetical protein BECKH772C_GA0070978_100693 [Candidatus Kentron sp. H]
MNEYGSAFRYRDTGLCRKCCGTARYGPTPPDISIMTISAPSLPMARSKLLDEKQPFGLRWFL